MLLNKRLYEKLQRYCEYAERCHNDVRKKCISLKIPKDDVDMYLQRLVEENFLNETRFIKSFVYTRHTYKKWGVEKIKAALAAKGIRAAEAQPYLADITAADTRKNALNAATQKWRSIKGEHRQARKVKLLRFLIGRGFDMKTASEVVKLVAES